jgi:signal transduction histidine kinase
LMLHYASHDGPLDVYGDPDRIEQVLLILLDNALKHSPHGATVWVEGSRVMIEERRERLDTDLPSAPLPSGEWVMICVTDSGLGISKKDLPHVFDRFYRADLSRSRDRGGSGLGLSIAKVLIEAQGGHIWLESPSKSPRINTDQMGTTACFALPAA